MDFRSPPGADMDPHAGKPLWSSLSALANAAYTRRRARSRIMNEHVSRHGLRGLRSPLAAASVALPIVALGCNAALGIPSEETLSLGDSSTERHRRETATNKRRVRRAGR